MLRIPLFILLAVPGALAQTLTPQAFNALAARCAPDAAVSTLYSIAKTESDLYPEALSIDYPRETARLMKFPPGWTVGLQRQPASTSEALQWARWLIQRNHSVSVGLMQIQSDDLARLGVTLEQAYEPCDNIALGAYVLRLHYHAAAARIGPGPRAWIAAISSYNTGSSVAGIQNGYVRRILNRRTLK